ncbi:zinc finger protein ZFP2 [Tribolium castaneum]|nr:PREDICTED: zinc finger protein 2 homolog [Tribolium castaneum]|eukprot:XP_001809587.2 PREDICTED: zinc finger protein 2 homolog [Tribolium castaneum]
MINKTTELVIDKICRSCMCQNENMRNVFDSKELGGQTLQLAEMLMDCAAVVIASGDGLPNLLCITCEDKLNLAYEFKQQCQKSDTTLRELTNQSDSVIKEETCDIVVQPDFNIPELYNDTDSEDDDSKPKSFTCPFCQKVLRTKKGLRIHQRRHTGDKLRSCHLCNAQFTRTHHLIRHMKTHVKGGDTGHVCGECGMSFMKLSHLLSHKKTHKGDKSDEGESGQQSTAADNNSDCDNDITLEINEDEDDDDDDALEEYFKPKTKTSKKDKGTYECKFCFKIMTTFVGLKIHMRRHTGSDLAKCKLCDKSFTKTSHLKRHLQTHGIKELDKPKPAEKKVMECEFCDRKFKYKKSFNHHMQTEHGMSDESDVPLSAYISKMKEPEESKEDSSEKPEKTDEAEPSSDQDTKEEIPPVAKPVHHKVHVCHVCEAAFARANHLTRHMTLHRALLIHKCDRCDKAYATLEHLAKHVEEDHINKPYACTICNKPFSRGEHLIRHLKVHQTGNEKEDNLTCSICEKTFSRSDHLARHIKIHLLQDKRHVCSECGKAFNRLDNLKTHQRIHTGIKDTTKLHLCIYCGKEFNNSSNMIVHMRRHTGERPYKCSQCGKGFPRSHDLKCHERTHSGEKPYHCALCGKSFNKSNKLLRHTRVHTGERPYVCNICGRAFTQSNDLALHMRRHTGARPYACGMCPARFIQSGQLKTHRRTTGHWVETQPDLKGGHRVEPVTPVMEPTPIRFKTHGKKKDDEVDEAKGKILAHTMGLMGPLNVSGENLVIDPKIVELQNSGLINLMGAGEVKFKEGGFVVSQVKSEGEKVQGFGQGGAVTYSIVAPVASSTTFTAADYSNYQNFG